MDIISKEFDDVVSYLRKLTIAESSFSRSSKTSSSYNSCISYAKTVRSCICSLDNLNSKYFKIDTSFVTQCNMQCVLYYIECYHGSSWFKYQGVWNTKSETNKYKYDSSYITNNGGDIYTLVSYGSKYFDEKFNIYDAYYGNKVGSSRNFSYDGKGTISFNINGYDFTAKIY